MSLPSATQSPLASNARCLATSASRTPGSAASVEAASVTRGSRIARVTSWPSSSTSSPRNSMRDPLASAAGSLAGEASHIKATLRYIAPLSR